MPPAPATRPTRRRGNRKEGKVSLVDLLPDVDTVTNNGVEVDESVAGSHLIANFVSEPGRAELVVEFTCLVSYGRKGLSGSWLANENGVVGTAKHTAHITIGGGIRTYDRLGNTVDYSVRGADKDDGVIYLLVHTPVG